MREDLIEKLKKELQEFKTSDFVNIKELKIKQMILNYIISNDFSLEELKRLYRINNTLQVLYEFYISTCDVKDCIENAIYMAVNNHEIDL